MSCADAEHWESQLLEDHLDCILEGVVAGSRGAHERAGDADCTGAKRERLGHIDPVAHTAAGDDGAIRRHSLRLDERLGGGDAPAGEPGCDAGAYRIADAVTLDLAPRGPAGAGDVDGR